MRFITERPKASLLSKDSRLVSLVPCYLRRLVSFLSLVSSIHSFYLPFFAKGHCFHSSFTGPDTLSVEHHSFLTAVASRAGLSCFLLIINKPAAAANKQHAWMEKWQEEKRKEKSNFN